jgi:N-acyl-D-amino-acid deacylase
MYDVLIRGGKIIDGTGEPGFLGDVAILDGKLKIFPGGSNVDAKEVVDAAGKCVCPGFIDVHSHADLFFLNPLVHNTAKASQGVTAEVAGQCGLSDFPTRSCDEALYARHKQEQSRLNTLKPEQTDTFAGYRKYIESVDKATHIKQLVGHGCIRRAVMGSENREATPEELEMMKSLLREAMENGAAGLSSGLVYPPGIFTKAHELTELCKVVAEYDGVYTSHMRDEGQGLLESIRETLDTAMAAGCRLNISHLKAMGVPAWGLSEKALEMIEEAAAKGLDVVYDVYPFTASMTSFQACLPPKEHTFTREERTARLKDPVIREEIKKALRNGESLKFSTLRSLDDVLLIDCPVTVQYRGKTVAQVAREQGIDPLDAMLDILAENACATNCVYFTLSEDDLT